MPPKAFWKGSSYGTARAEALPNFGDGYMYASGAKVSLSARVDTQARYAELGFAWASNTSGRYRPEFAAIRAEAGQTGSY